MSFGDDTLDPDNAKPPKPDKPVYRRQMVLLEVILARQNECTHTLSTPLSGIIICTECGALWVK